MAGAKFTYRGLTTKQLYRFTTSQAPPETLVTINGEPCVLVNNDGSIQRGAASAPPPGAAVDTHTPTNVYATYASPSVWEQN